MRLDGLGQLLEHAGRGAPTSGACRHLGPECAQAEALQDVQACMHLDGAVAARFGREARPDRVADPLLQQHRQRCGGRDDALCAHPRLGQAEVQRVVAARGEVAVHGHHVRQAADLARDDDAVVPQADLLRGGRGRERALHHGLAEHLCPGNGVRPAGIRLHQAVEELGIERPGVDADPHGPVVIDRGLDHGGEVPVMPRPPPHVAGVDAELGKCLRHGGELRQERMPVEVEVAHQGHVAAVVIAEACRDLGHPGRGLAVVHGDPDQLRPGSREFRDLLRRGHGVLGVGVGHRLHHDGGAATDGHAADEAARAHATGPLHGPGV